MSARARARNQPEPSPEVKRLMHLGEEAEAKLAACIPTSDVPWDDPRRRNLGPQWDEVVSLWTTIYDQAQSTEWKSASIFYLIPEFAHWMGEARHWPHAIYDPRTAEFGRALLQRTEDPCARSAAAACIAASLGPMDWAGACHWAAEACKFEIPSDSLAFPCQLLTDAGVLDFLRGELLTELRATEAHIRLAFDLFAEDHRAYPPDEVLWDGARLWDAILPYLPAAMVGVTDTQRRNPEWTDFTTNRLTSTPGLRVAAVSRDARSGEGVARPRLHFETVFPGDPSR